MPTGDAEQEVHDSYAIEDEPVVPVRTAPKSMTELLVVSFLSDGFVMKPLLDRVTLLAGENENLKLNLPDWSKSIAELDGKLRASELPAAASVSD